MFFENKLKLKTVKYEQNEYGEYENSPEEEITEIRGSIQPLNWKERTLMNKDGEGNDLITYYKLYTPPNVVLKTKGNKTGHTQTILFNGEEFEIVSKDQYMSGLIKHNKYILQQLTKEGEEEDASEVQEDNL